MKDNLFDGNHTNLVDLSDIKPHVIKSNTNDNEKKKLIEENDSEKKMILLQKKFNYICQKKGNTYIIMVDQNNNPLLTVGPEWIFFCNLYPFYFMRIFLFIYILLQIYSFIFIHIRHYYLFDFYFHLHQNVYK